MNDSLTNSSSSILKTNHTFKKSLLVTGIALALTACGGSNSDSEPGTTSDSISESVSSATSTFSGTVADGYLVDAKVCLDLNDNKVCDEDDPSAISTEGGQFTIEGVTQEQLDTHAIVVQVIEGLTVDEDEPDVVIDKAYTMTAPAGYDFVSPLTTMVHQELEENKDNDDFSVTDAEATIKAKLGTTMDLREDYVEAKGEESDYTETEKEEFEKLHKVAQVTARVLKENIDAVKEVVDESEISFDQILDMVVSQVLDSLQTINEQVDEAIEEDNFDPDTLSQSEDITEVVDVDVDTVEEEIAARQAEKQASAADLVGLVTSVGINWFEGDRHDGELKLHYGSFQHDNTTGQSNDSKYYYDPVSRAFVMGTDDGDDEDYLLTAEGWKSVSENETITINEDGSITVANTEVPSYAERLEASQFNITGLNIGATLAQSGHNGHAWAKVVDSEAEFGTGSMGFKLTFTTINDQFRMWDWDCDESQIVGDMCNSVWSNKGDGDWSTDGPASALADLISDTESNATNPGQIRGPQVAWYPDGSSIYAEMLSDGHVTYYQTSFTGDGNGFAQIISEGAWSDRTIGAVTVRTMELPTNILGDGDIGYEDRFIFFTEKGGFVRRGEFIPAGEVDHGEVVFNIEARDDVIAAFRDERFNALAAEIEQDHNERNDSTESGDNSGSQDQNGDTIHNESDMDGGSTAEESKDDETDSSAGDDGTVHEDHMGAEEENQPEPLATTLKHCDIANNDFHDGNDFEDSASSPTFATRADFDAAVAQCLSISSFNPDFIINKRFIIAEMPNESVEFSANGEAVFKELLPNGTTKAESLTWEIIAGELMIVSIGSTGEEERESLTLIAAQDGELSVKGFSEHSEDYQGMEFDGTHGKIWSGILIEDIQI